MKSTAHPLAGDPLGIPPGVEGRDNGWLPIESAPHSTAVEVRVGKRRFPAILMLGVSMTSEGRPCDQWWSSEEGNHPADWTDGACWESNSNEQMSGQPSHWRHLTAPIA